MFYIEWLTPAFDVLERLPQPTFVKIVRQVDLLMTFPEMGTVLGLGFSPRENYRQIIINKDYRVIYEVDRKEETVFILLIQSCRQKLPSARDLKRL